MDKHSQNCCHFVGIFGFKNDNTKNRMDTGFPADFLKCSHFLRFFTKVHGCATWFACPTSLVLYTYTVVILKSNI